MARGPGGEVPPGPLWPRITGPEGAKAIFPAELGELIPALR